MIPSVKNNSSEEGWDDYGTEAYYSAYYATFRHTPLLTTILILAYGTVLIVGVIGNSLVVGVILKSPRMRTVTNLFICNLAIADLLVLLFCLPPTLLSNILVEWILGYWMCKTVPYIQGVSVCASVYSLVAVSLDRFIAIWFPLGSGLTKSRARLIILLIWIISLTLAIPWAVFFEIVSPVPAEEFGYEYTFCIENWPESGPLANAGDLYFLIGNFVLCYLLPLTGITLCYFLIWCRVMHRQIPDMDGPTGGGGRPGAATLNLIKVHHKAKISVLRMLVVVVSCFVLSWAPLYALFIRIKLGGPLSAREEHIVGMITPLAQWLGSSNSCINPVLYAFLNVKFRRGFMSLLPNCCAQMLMNTGVRGVGQRPTRASITTAGNYCNNTKSSLLLKRQQSNEKP